MHHPASLFLGGCVEHLPSYLRISMCSQLGRCSFHETVDEHMHGADISGIRIYAASLMFVGGGGGAI